MRPAHYLCGGILSLREQCRFPIFSEQSSSKIWENLFESLTEAEQSASSSPLNKNRISKDADFCTGGVFWTKFEHCMNKIHRILINFARAERVVALNQIVRSDFVAMLTIRASRSFQSRTKTKNFLTFPFKTAGGCRGEPQKIERKFYGFVFVASLLQKRLVNKI
ncbi:MAG: hypothetical protein H8D63_01655 [Parcubacteria group bacterium]|nr:hypothetical protein [Parcubacteria group bacterium]